MMALMDIFDINQVLTLMLGLMVRSMNVKRINARSSSLDAVFNHNQEAWDTNLRIDYVYVSGRDVQ